MASEMASSRFSQDGLWGILTVLGLNKVLASLVYAVSAADPATWAGFALLFGCVSLAARYCPARRDQDRCLK
jgi:hypothetical protein